MTESSQLSTTLGKASSDVPGSGSGYDSSAGVIQREIQGALRRIGLAFHIAWTDTRIRYRRSVLGPFWLVLGTIIGVGGLAFVWGALLKVDTDVFVPSITIGLVVWYLLSSTIMESTGVFYNNRQSLLNMPVSSLLLSLQLLLRQLINFGHNLVVVVIVLVIIPKHLNAMSFLVIPGFLLVAINLLWIIQFIGYLGARYRDLEPLVMAIMQPLFFLTPVIFRPNQLGDKSFLLQFNPLTHLLSLIRDPLMGSNPSMLNWSIALAMAILGWAAALYMTAKKRHRLSYWVN